MHHTHCILGAVGSPYQAPGEQTGGLSALLKGTTANNSAPVQGIKPTTFQSQVDCPANPGHVCPNHGGQNGILSLSTYKHRSKVTRVASQTEKPPFGKSQSEPRPESNRDAVEWTHQSHSHQTSTEYSWADAVLSERMITNVPGHCAGQISSYKNTCLRLL